MKRSLKQAKDLFGYRRDLTPKEVEQQVEFVARRRRTHDPDDPPDVADRDYAFKDLVDSFFLNHRNNDR